MATERIYNHHCPTCHEQTPHVLARSLSRRIVLRTWKLLVFFLSGGFIYPQPLPSEEDPIEVKCTKCLSACTIIGG